MQTQLPRRPYVELPPPPDGLMTARREAGRRRTRRAVAVVTGGVSAVVLVIVVLMVGGGGGVAVLRPAPVPPATQVPAPNASKAPTVVGGRPAGQPSSPPRGSRPVVVGPAATASPESTPPPAGRPADTRASVVVVRTQSRYSGYPRVCRTGDSADNQSVRPGANWCTEAAAAPSDGGERLSFTLCRDSTSGGTLTFTGSREVDFAVVSGGKTIWSWSHDHPGTPSQHTLSATADGCWIWSLVWPGTTQAGAAAGHGSYTLVATTTAQELRGDASPQIVFSY